jgi:hypothetical protein
MKNRQSFGSNATATALAGTAFFLVASCTAAAAQIPARPFMLAQAAVADDKDKPIRRDERPKKPLPSSDPIDKPKAQAPADGNRRAGPGQEEQRGRSSQKGDEGAGRGPGAKPNPNASAPQQPRQAPNTIPAAKSEPQVPAKPSAQPAKPTDKPPAMIDKPAATIDKPGERSQRGPASEPTPRKGLPGDSRRALKPRNRRRQDPPDPSHVHRAKRPKILPLSARPSGPRRARRQTLPVNQLLLLQPPPRVATWSLAIVGRHVRPHQYRLFRHSQPRHRPPFGRAARMHSRLPRSKLAMPGNSSGVMALPSKEASKMCGRAVARNVRGTA